MRKCEAIGEAKGQRLKSKAIGGVRGIRYDASGTSGIGAALVIHDWGNECAAKYKIEDRRKEGVERARMQEA